MWVGRPALPGDEAGYLRWATWVECAGPDLIPPFPDGLRRAVAARDGGCAYPGCDRPPSWIEIHHILPWEDGGETTLSNLVMVCRGHHRQMHFSEWVVRIRDRLPEFIPPEWVDESRTPRRKALPHLAGLGEPVRSDIR